MQEQAERAKFLEMVKSNELLAGREIVENPPDQAKMSGVLLEFAAPLLERFEPEISAEKIIGVAIVAWNLSLLPEAEHSRLLDELAGKMSLNTEGVKEMNDAITWLVDRKRKHFTEHRRHILDYRVSDLGGQRNLQVVSTLVPQDRQSKPD